MHANKVDMDAFRLAVSWFWGVVTLLALLVVWWSVDIKSTSKTLFMVLSLEGAPAIVVSLIMTGLEAFGLRTDHVNLRIAGAIAGFFDVVTDTTYIWHVSAPQFVNNTLAHIAVSIVSGTISALLVESLGVVVALYVLRNFGPAIVAWVDIFTWFADGIVSVATYPERSLVKGKNKRDTF